MSRITTPFDAQSTAVEVIAGVDLTGKRAVVTGASSGIGRETARVLAAAGAEVTLAVRDTDAGRRAAAEIRPASGHGTVRVAHIELTHRATIDAFTAGWTGPLDILVNNAGIMAPSERTDTAEGWEAQFATNHLGPAALTLGLHEALSAAHSARVVFVASSGHQLSKVVFDDIHFTGRPYDVWSAYGQSKTASILFMTALAKKWASDGITVNALHPGGVITKLQRSLDEAQLRYVGAMDEQGRRPEVPAGWKSVGQGAATSVLLAASPLVQGVSGHYFEDGNEAVVLTEPGDGMSGVFPYALDAHDADRLWDETIRLLQR
jgi:NAD(P)-dependent dehydrogenase (short-subunit alcohol dehydrogenase family)